MMRFDQALAFFISSVVAGHGRILRGDLLQVLFIQASKQQEGSPLQLFTKTE